MKDISIVAPVFDEVENIDNLCSQLDAVLSKIDKSYEIVLIDDGSSDGTWEKLVENSTKYGHIKLIRFRRNFGQTAAMSAGFDKSIGDIIITLDADLQNDPADIPLLLAEMDKGFDVVSGWRKNRQDTFINRRLPSIIANALISKITSVPLHDYGCTLKAYRREIVSNIRLYGEMHRFIPALADWVGGKISEVVVNHRPRTAGTSKYGISRTYKVLLDLMTVKFLLRYSHHPIQMFGKIGMSFGLPGIALFLTMMASHIGYTLFGIEALAGLVTVFKRPAWIITTFMLMLFFMQFISMGLLAEIQIRTYHESQSKPIYVIKETVEPKVA